MKSNLKLAVLVFGGLAASFIAADSRAQTVTVNTPVGAFTGSPTHPGATWSFSSPQLSVFAGVLTGNNLNTNVVQSSARNVSSFAQVGNNLSATVHQSGQNLSNIAQVGHKASALVVQFGH